MYTQPLRFLQLVALLLLGACTAAAEQQDKRLLDMDPESCRGCHAEEVSEWKESRHAVSYSNGIFQSEFVPKRQVWCAECHAPSAPDHENIDNTDLRASQGVGCMGCHLQKGIFVSRSVSSKSPHQTQEDKTFGSPAWCANCHEFNYPFLDTKGRLLRYSNRRMQEVFTQYKASGIADQSSCLDCHGETPGKHRFPGSHHLDTLRSALDLSVCRDNDSLVVTLENIGAGHNVPTGGVHRGMKLRLWKESSPTKLFSAFLGRTFRPTSDGLKETVSDTTIPVGKQSVYRIKAKNLGEQEETIRLELRYIYGLDESAKIPNTKLSAAAFRQEILFETLSRCE